MSTKAVSTHSPLGASSAERWLNCPGSNVLIKTLGIEKGEESEFAAEGTAAHELASVCLRGESDAWEQMGLKFYDHQVTAEMADAVQVYLDEVRRLLAEQGPVAKHLIEHRISDKSISDNFYGTVDDAIIGEEYLDVTDYKHGVGIAVDADHNPQLMYYAVGILSTYLGPKKVRLRIVQPRAFHPDGPIRVWETTTELLLAWRDLELKPAMQRAELDATLLPGDWCRFCPARLACPMLSALFGAMATADPKAVSDMSDAALGRNYALLPVAQIYRKALEAEMFARLNLGKEFLEAKLVAMRADRILKDGAEPVARQVFGPEAYNPPSLKSPAQLDALGVKGKLFTKEWAYTPQTGLTVAPRGDKRAEIKVQPAAETFAAYKDVGQ